jgi:hypothetical protein
MAAVLMQATCEDNGISSQRLTQVASDPATSRQAVNAHIGGLSLSQSSIKSVSEETKSEHRSPEKGHPAFAMKTIKHTPSPPIDQEMETDDISPGEEIPEEIPTFSSIRRQGIVMPKRRLPLPDRVWSIEQLPYNHEAETPNASQHAGT